MRRAGEVVSKARDPRQRVGLRVRGRPQHRRGLHPPPAPQARRAVRPPADPDHPRRRLPARSRAAADARAPLRDGPGARHAGGGDRRRRSRCVVGAFWLVHAHRSTRSPTNLETAARLRSQRHRGGDRRRRLPPAARRCRAATRTSRRSSTATATSSRRRRTSRATPASAARSPAPTGTPRAPSAGSPAGRRPVPRRGAARRRRPTGIYTVYVARQPRGASPDSTDSLVRLLLVGAPARCSLLVGATTWVVTGRALRPVEAIRARGRGRSAPRTCTAACPSPRPTTRSAGSRAR